MERVSIVKLIGIRTELSPIGEPIDVEEVTEVYGTITSVTASEWFQARRDDINSRCRVLVHSFEYSDQEFVEIGGTRYKVYRHFENNEDFTELYLEEKVGTK